MYNLFLFLLICRNASILIVACTFLDISNVMFKIIMLSAITIIKRDGLFGMV